nr:basic proline-rich protein-like [Dasypus novemcinctus]
MAGRTQPTATRGLGERSCPASGEPPAPTHAEELRARELRPSQPGAGASETGASRCPLLAPGTWSSLRRKWNGPFPLRPAPRGTLPRPRHRGPQPALPSPSPRGSRHLRRHPALTPLPLRAPHPSTLLQITSPPGRLRLPHPAGAERALPALTPAPASAWTHAVPRCAPGRRPPARPPLDQAGRSRTLACAAPPSPVPLCPTPCLPGWQLRAEPSIRPGPGAPSGRWSGPAPPPDGKLLEAGQGQPQVHPVESPVELWSSARCKLGNHHGRRALEGDAPLRQGSWASSHRYPEHPRGGQSPGAEAERPEPRDSRAQVPPAAPPSTSVLQGGRRWCPRRPQDAPRAPSPWKASEEEGGPHGPGAAAPPGDGREPSAPGPPLQTGAGRPRAACVWTNPLPAVREGCLHRAGEGVARRDSASLA